MTETARTTIDASEIEHFSRIAAQWWDPQGKFRPLHKFNPTRLTYIKEKVCEKFNRDPNSPRPFEGLRFLDIGCGGGLLCEPMSRLGATVIGADASETNIEVAKFTPPKAVLRSIIALLQPKLWLRLARNSMSCSTWKWSNMSLTSICSCLRPAKW